LSHGWKSRGDGKSRSRSISWEEYARQRDADATRQKKSVGRVIKRRSVRISILGKKKKHEDPTPNNLSAYRWRIPLPSPERAAELVRRAREGDQEAARELVTIYHAVIIGCARKHRISYRFDRRGKEHTNSAFDDLIGRGFEALWQAVLSYKPSLGVPFDAYARRCISGQLSEESKAFVKRGLTRETRLDRWLFSHPNATPSQLVAAFKKRRKHISESDAGAEIRAFKARHSFQPYQDQYIKGLEHYQDQYLEEPRINPTRRTPAD
jgi:hypothetical protein